MLSTYNLLLFAHVLLFVYWLGSDVGVFYGVRYVLRPDLQPETRRTVMALVHWIDAFPRICLVLMVPVGASLSLQLGLVNVPASLHAPVLLAVWILGIGWLVLVLRIYGGAKGWITSVDWIVRITVMLGFFGAGAASLAGFGPVVEGANWLAAKFILFAGAIGCGIGLRLLGRPFGKAYTQIMQGGSTPALERDLQRAMQQSRRIVVVLWILVAMTGFLGLAKAI